MWGIHPTNHAQQLDRRVRAELGKVSWKAREGLIGALRERQEVMQGQKLARPHLVDQLLKLRGK